MSELIVWSSLPSSLPTWTKTGDKESLLRLFEGNGVEIIVSGSGSVTVYLWCDDAGWRKHPSGIDLTDDGSFHRLMLGAPTKPRVRSLLVVSSQLIRVWAQEVNY